jgi:prophage regulatory protein
MPASNNTDLKVIDFKELKDRVKLSRSTIYSYMDELSPQYCPDFPKSILIGKTAVRWLSTAVDDYIRLRINQSRSKGRASRFTAVH